MNKNDKLDVDFKSLKYNSDWKAVYKKYQDNIAVFSELIEDMQFLIQKHLLSSHMLVSAQK